MDTNLAHRIADDLFRQVMERTPFAPLRIAGRSVDMDMAYAIQDRLVERLQEDGLGPSAGYKVGLTSKAMQDFCRVGEPIIGRILERRVHESGLTVPMADFVRPGIECELAVRIGRRVPVLKADETPSRLRDCVASIHAAFEIVEDRGADYTTLDAASIIAENSWNAGIVVAEGVPPSALGDLDCIPGRLFVGDAMVGEGVSGDVMGGPLDVVKWLSRFLAGRGQTLEPGQWVMTGAVIPTQFPAAGDVLQFELENLPPVSLSVC